jgi:hypothetical protein
MPSSSRVCGVPAASVGVGAEEAVSSGDVEEHAASVSAATTARVSPALEWSLFICVTFRAGDIAGLSWNEFFPIPIEDCTLLQVPLIG